MSAPPKRTVVLTRHRVRCAFVNVPALGRRTPVLAGASKRPGSRANASASSSPSPRARRAFGEQSNKAKPSFRGDRARDGETRAMVDEGWTTVEKKAPKEAAASGRGGGGGLNGKDRGRGAGA